MAFAAFAPSASAAVVGVEQAGLTPATKHLTGTGAEIVNGFGHVVLDQIEPNEELTTTFATGSETQSGYSGNWWIRAYAICVAR